VHDKAVNRVVFAPDGKTVASANADRTIKLWDVGNGKLTRLLKGHYSPVGGLSFAPDGKTLASASDDQKVGLWDLETGKEIHRQPGHKGRKDRVARNETPLGEFFGEARHGNADA
jgi:WD40 repeat protein